MINFKDWFGKKVAKKIQARPKIIFLVCVLVITGCGILAGLLRHMPGIGLHGDFGGKRTGSAGNSGQSGRTIDSSPNAWKFADLIRDGTLYPIAHVIDGDTLVAVVDGHDVTVRLIGMDTPETVDPRKPVECFGPQASAAAKAIFLGSTSDENTPSQDTAGQEIYLEKDPVAGDYDKYGRALAYVRLSDGTLYNLEMIQNGYAREYTYMNQAYKYRDQFKSAQNAAKRAGLGVWNKSVCPKPFSY